MTARTSDHCLDCARPSGNDTQTRRQPPFPIARVRRLGADSASVMLADSSAGRPPINETADATAKHRTSCPNNASRGSMSPERTVGFAPVDSGRPVDDWLRPAVHERQQWAVRSTRGERLTIDDTEPRRDEVHVGHHVAREARRDDPGRCGRCAVRRSGVRRARGCVDLRRERLRDGQAPTWLRLGPDRFGGRCCRRCAPVARPWTNVIKPSPSTSPRRSG